MEMLKLPVLCVACLLPVILLRKNAPEQAMLLTLAILAVVMARCLEQAAPLLEELRALFARAGVETAYVSILLRTAAAAVVTRLCADLCKDGGSQALASAVDTLFCTTVEICSMPWVISAVFSACSLV